MKVNVEMVNISRLNVCNISGASFVFIIPTQQYLLLEFTAIIHAGQKAPCMQHRLQKGRAQWILCSTGTTSVSWEARDKEV